MQKPNTPQVTERAIEHIFEVVDDAHPERSVWFHVEPSVFGVSVTVYKERPSGENFQIPIATTITELFNNKVNVRVWDEPKSKEDGEPLALNLCANVDTWTPDEEESED